MVATARTKKRNGSSPTLGWKCTGCGTLVAPRSYGLAPCPKCRGVEFQRVALVHSLAPHLLKEGTKP